MPDGAHAHAQMQLLVDLMPYVSEDFALKGGTAINMFYRDLPRYSVDMDLVYLPRTDRLTAVRSVRGLLEQMRRAAQRGLRGVKTSQVRDGQDERAGLLWVEVRRGMSVSKLRPLYRGGKLCTPRQSLMPCLPRNRNSGERE